MKITLESTAIVVELQTRGGSATIEARLWQGETSAGVPVVAWIPMLAPAIDPTDTRQVDFQQELSEHTEPRPAVEAIPLRLVI